LITVRLRDHHPGGAVGALPTLARAAALQPLLLIRRLSAWCRDQRQSSAEFLHKGLGRFNESLLERDPLTELEGVNLYDRARLSEEGVDNIENLAHHNMIHLLVQTRIPVSRLVDMFDQAILYLHLRGVVPVTRPASTPTESPAPAVEASPDDQPLSALDYLRSYGIRGDRSVLGRSGQSLNLASLIAAETILRTRGAG
jgi:hypothetical protein